MNSLQAQIEEARRLAEEAETEIARQKEQEQAPHLQKVQAEKRLAELEMQQRAGAFAERVEAHEPLEAASQQAAVQAMEALEEAAAALRGVDLKPLRSAVAAFNQAEKQRLASAEGLYRQLKLEMQLDAAVGVKAKSLTEERKARGLAKIATRPRSLELDEWFDQAAPESPGKEAFMRAAVLYLLTGKQAYLDLFGQPVVLRRRQRLADRTGIRRRR